MSISGYRKLMRSINYAFKNDVFAINLARKQLKTEFLNNKHNVDNLESLLKDIDDVDIMLKFHIVQGVKSDKGIFEVKLSPKHHVTIESGQELQHGPELEPIDPSYIGQSVTVYKTKGDRKPLNLGDLS